jgi:hypothetical protein
VFSVVQLQALWASEQVRLSEVVLEKLPEEWLENQRKSKENVLWQVKKAHRLEIRMRKAGIARAL